jgi:bacteriochlorophyll 4-vinyl reductase
MASLHKALEDLAPEKVEVFEGWFDPFDRKARIHIAPVLGAVSYLRRETELYSRIMERAGRYASQWGYLDRSLLERRLLMTLPLALRGGLVGYILRSGLAQVHRDVRLRVLKDPERLVVDVDSSLFCRMGGPADGPVCVYYAALFAGLLDRTGLARPPVIETACHAQGSRSCRFEAAR